MSTVHETKAQGERQGGKADCVITPFINGSLSRVKNFLNVEDVTRVQPGVMSDSFDENFLSNFPKSQNDFQHEKNNNIDSVISLFSLINTYY